MGKLSKKSKIIIIISAVLGSIVITYFGGSLIATSAVDASIFNHRTELSELDENPYYLLHKTRDDYSSLSSRKEFIIKHNKLNLQAYLYEQANPNGLVIATHGVSSFADSDQAQIHDYFYNKGWDVLTFDMVGCGRSEGKNMVGLYESKYIVDSVLKYVSSDDSLKEMPIWLIGHSWGAYGVTSSSKNHEKVYAIAALSGYNAPNEMMYEYVKNHQSPAFVLGKPGLDFSLGLTKGPKAFDKASSEIKKHQDIDYMIVQGSDDDIVYYGASLYSCFKKKSPENVSLEYIENGNHVGIWRSTAAVSYYQEVRNQYSELEKQYKGNIPEDSLNEFLLSVDKEKTSELNLSLMDKINDMFLNSLTNIK